MHAHLLTDMPNKKDNQYIIPHTRGIYKIFIKNKYKISMISHKDDKQLNINKTNNDCAPMIDNVDKMATPEIAA